MPDKPYGELTAQHNRITVGGGVTKILYFGKHIEVKFVVKCVLTRGDDL